MRGDKQHAEDLRCARKVWKEKLTSGGKAVEGVMYKIEMAVKCMQKKQGRVLETEEAQKIKEEQLAKLISMELGSENCSCFCQEFLGLNPDHTVKRNGILACVKYPVRMPGLNAHCDPWRPHTLTAAYKTPVSSCQAFRRNTEPSFPVAQAKDFCGPAPLCCGPPGSNSASAQVTLTHTLGCCSPLDLGFVRPQILQSPKSACTPEKTACRRKSVFRE
ncbi:hypothetical protein H920_14608 [Fukomys damarensis]|uniref:Uncharacterized protein n=1 Tax=Fukomys damarensis TaxID=885580 RepID=A0A091CWC5_FUKDA|nr:hypothetical protein H920_14608 [Fukomys damarensis]